MTKLFGALELAAKAALRRFSAFDQESFFEIANEPARKLELALGSHSSSIVAGYLEMIADAVGTGMLGMASPDATSSMAGARALRRILLELLPTDLGNVEPEARARFLVDCFNLVDSIAHERSWVSEWVAARIGGLDDSATLERVIAEELRSLETRRAGQLVPPFRLTCADPRTVAPDFLPGMIHFVEAHVICIHDQLSSSRLGLVIGQEPKLSAGTLDCLGESTSLEPLAIPVEAHDRGLLISAHEVSFPLGTPGSVLSSQLGFVVVTSKSSQRVWVVEGASDAR